MRSLGKGAAAIPPCHLCCCLSRFSTAATSRCLLLSAPFILPRPRLAFHEISRKLTLGAPRRNATAPPLLLSLTVPLYRAAAPPLLLSSPCSPLLALSCAHAQAFGTSWLVNKLPEQLATTYGLVVVLVNYRGARLRPSGFVANAVGASLRALSGALQLPDARWLAPAACQRPPPRPQLLCTLPAQQAHGASLVREKNLKGTKGAKKLHENERHSKRQKE